MKSKLYALSILFILLIGCSSPELEKQLSDLKTELETTKSELKACSDELEVLKNTAENRFIRANKLLSEKNYEGAINELDGIVINFKGTQEASDAVKEIEKIKRILEEKRIEEERKKELGFKILKPSSQIQYGDLTLKFEKIWIGKSWTFDDYGDSHFYRNAERGFQHVLARVNISSEINDPSLPPILVYNMSDGKLTLIGTLGYEFRRWEDYGSYLGNSADYGNDFAHSKSIPFNCGVELPEKSLKSGSVYVVLLKKGCFERLNIEYGNPEVRYGNIGCNPKSTLKVEDFDNEYSLLKIL